MEERACDGTENDGTDGTTRILTPVATDTQEMQDIIAAQPTVDAVPVIRCKDCAWYDDLDHCRNPKCVKSYYGTPVHPEHFCGFAVRDD